MPQSPESQSALGDKPYRPHPAAPAETPPDEQSAPASSSARPLLAPAQPRNQPEALVPLSVRVPNSLRRRVRAAAFQDDASIQDLVVAALDAELARRGL